MRVLRKDLTGEDVRQWQWFLIGQGLLSESANGVFDDATFQATVDFQRAHGLHADGWVGTYTYGAASQHGFPLVEDEDAFEAGPGWPPAPKFPPLVSTAERQRVFGTFSYEPAPSPSNPEGIKIHGDWAAKNIVSVEIPQLAGVRGAPSSGKILLHRLVAEQFKAMFAEWEKAGFRHLLKSFGGSYVPRFIRGSRQTLSNHAFGTALDINVPWNYLGAQPALKGKPGSVRELVPIANSLGIYWGGHFKSRPDGMHFEAAYVNS